MKFFDKNSRKIAQLTFQHKKTLSFVLLITLIEAGSAPIAIWLFSEVISALTTMSESIQYVVVLTIISAMITVVSVVFQNFMYIAIEGLGLRVYQDIFEQSYDHVVRANITDEEESDFKTAFAAAKAWLETLLNRAIGFLTNGIFQLSIAAFIILTNFGWRYFLMLLLFVFIPLGLYIPFAKKIMALINQSNETNLKTNRSLSQLVENLRLISVFQTRNYEKRKAIAQFDNYKADQMGLASGFAKFNIFRNLVNALILVVLMIILILDVYAGKIDVGQVFLFYSYMQIFVAQFSFIPQVYLQIKRDIKRLEPLLDTDKLKPIMDEKPPVIYPIINRIVVRDFACDYLPDLEADAVYEFEKGQIYWLKGENGAGKSTFLKAIMGLEGAAQIDVSIETDDGEYDLKPQDCARNFAYASQEPQIWDRSVEENLDYAKRGDYGSEIPVDFAKSLADDPAFARIDFEKNANGLSGGQTQLVHIYRAIGKNTPVLLLDEPTNALDGEVILELIQTLKARVPHAIVIMATHSEYLQKIATREMRIERKAA